MAYGNDVPTNQDYTGMNEGIGNKGTGDNPSNNFWRDMQYNMPEEDEYSSEFEENQGGLLAYILNNMKTPDMVQGGMQGYNLPRPPARP